MTDHFEVHERDGTARLGELRLDEPVFTPALVDLIDAETGPDGFVRGILDDAGSYWRRDREIPSGAGDRLTILPHRAFPPGTEPEVMDAFDPEVRALDAPSAAVISPETARNHGTDAYVLSGGPALEGHAEAFVDAVIRTREAIPADSALLLSNAATPANVATLGYAGVDLVDPGKAIAEGTRGHYLTQHGMRFLDDLAELPCACPACEGGVEHFDRTDCVEHNVRELAAAVATTRERIRRGRLRDYLEGQARHEPWLTAALRRLDDRWGYLEPRTPIVRTARIAATTDDTLRRVEIRRFADRVTSRYRCRFDGPLALVPCSATKPYSESPSHRQFRRVIDYRAHLASMTSPIGVVPQELELTYPAQHYDTAVTGRWSETEVEFVSEVLRRYLERTAYPRVIAHVPDDYREITERVEDAVDVPFEYTVSGHPTGEESLDALSDALAGERRYQMRERQHNTLRAIADWQFGDGAGDELLPEGLRIQSRYPKLRAHDADDEQLAAMVPEYGTLALTLAGARRWVDSDAPTMRVEIDSFVPHGSVLAPGVVDADEVIRPGDEVVVEGPAAFGVGRAAMSGPEMAESTRGIAVDVRHVEER